MGIALSNILAFSRTLSTTVTSRVMLEIDFIADTRPGDETGDDGIGLPEDWPSSAAIESQRVTAPYL
ncbi:hypothetical protein J3458_013325 [Metarhizium acridum]|uniref:uncharacterized protein n=1 Tax=Metarhizium acridum TaxID=92637 RepID=UPI001C6C42D7|nr:hypothetical protein J3458_013325 [Metarhizium acridum]